MMGVVLKFLPSVWVRQLEEWMIKKAAWRVLEEKSYFLSSGQPRTKQFESWFSRKLGGARVIGVNSGTDALLLTLKALGVGADDEVIVPAFSFISTASCVLWAGARPVFADISLKDYALDPEDTEKKITTHTKAIILVHLYGQPASRTEQILSLVKKHNLFLIEDAAQATFSEVKLDGVWKQVGTLADAGCFSFAPHKILGSVGNSGAITVKESKYASVLDLMRFYGAKRHYWEYPVAGLNNKMQEVQAAVLLAKINFLEYWLEHRNKIAEIYNQNLKDISGLVLPEKIPQTQRVWYRYVIRVPARNRLFDFLEKKAGRKYHLRPAINYPIALPRLEVFKPYAASSDDFPSAEQAASQVISLPLNHSVTEKDAKDICYSIKLFLAEHLNS